MPTFQPIPEKPDASYWARQRALQAVLERRAMEN
jgi:hypothetical protein